VKLDFRILQGANFIPFRHPHPIEPPTRVTSDHHLINQGPRLRASIDVGAISESQLSLYFNDINEPSKIGLDLDKSARCGQGKERKYAVEVSSMQWY